MELALSNQPGKHVFVRYAPVTAIVPGHGDILVLLTKDPEAERRQAQLVIGDILRIGEIRYPEGNDLPRVTITEVGRHTVWCAEGKDNEDGEKIRVTLDITRWGWVVSRNGKEDSSPHIPTAERLQAVISFYDKCNGGYNNGKGSMNLSRAALTALITATESYEAGLPPLAPILIQLL